MIQRYGLLLAAVLMAVVVPLTAQTVNLTINGVPTGASFTSGEMLTWSIALPVGEICTNDLWVDVDQNGRVDPGTDRMIFSFQQQDGMGENDGPADMDGATNGVIFTQFPAGLAPAHWIFVASSGGSVDTSAFTVLPLSTLVTTISGQVTAPPAVDRSYILVQAESDADVAGMRPFWHALTDANGNYTIAMGNLPWNFNPWHVRLETSMLGRLVPVRYDTVLSVSTSSSIVNFDLIFGTVLTGRVVDQIGNPVLRSYPHVHPSADPEGEGHLGGNTDEDGYYRFVVPPGSWLLHFTKEGYKDAWWNGKIDRFQADVITTSSTQDTIKDLNATIVKAALIEGTVYNYGMPTSATVYLFTTPGENIVSMQGTNDDGTFHFTVDPGTYYVKFQKDMDTQYWDRQDFTPGTPITISGTETVSGIDGHFFIGPPPPPPGPQILKVWDVPFDNGGKVFIKFRGVEQYLSDNSGGGDMPFGVEKYTIWRFQKDGPVFVGEVPAAWDSTYTGVVPTLVDSNRVDPMIPAGPRWSRYIVKAHFLFNLYVIPSMVDSGYSLDNLAPNVPGGVGSAVAGNDVRIMWSRTLEEDLRYYSVYRGTTEGFSIVGLTPIVQTTDAAYTDPGGATGTYYYRVTATDFAGNESDPSTPVSSSGTTAAPDLGLMPTSFALGHNYPNPFNPATTIAFDVPSATTVRLDVYNALGQLVAELVSGEVGAGRHTVRFDATNLPSGLYMVRMHAGEFVAIRKINLIK